MWTGPTYFAARYKKLAWLLFSMTNLQEKSV